MTRGNESTDAERPAGWRPTLFLCLVLTGLWAAWSGPLSLHHPLLAAFGVLSIVVVVVLCRRMQILDAEITPLQLTRVTLAYQPWLTLQVLQSSYTVLRRGLRRPQPDIQVQTLEIGTRQRTSIGLVTLANSITLTPGTLTVDADGDSFRLRICALSDSGVRSLQDGEMDRRVEAIDAVQAREVGG